MTLFTPVDYWWSMEIVDLAQAEAATADDVESEVRRWPATHHGDLNENCEAQTPPNNGEIAPRSGDSRPGHTTPTIGMTLALLTRFRGFGPDVW